MANVLFFSFLCLYLNTYIDHVFIISHLCALMIWHINLVCLCTKESCTPMLVFFYVHVYKLFSYIFYTWYHIEEFGLFYSKRLVVVMRKEENLFCDPWAFQKLFVFVFHLVDIFFLVFAYLLLCIEWWGEVIDRIFLNRDQCNGTRSYQ